MTRGSDALTVAAAARCADWWRRVEALDAAAVAVLDAHQTGSRHVHEDNHEFVGVWLQQRGVGLIADGLPEDITTATTRQQLLRIAAVADRLGLIHLDREHSSPA